MKKAIVVGSGAGGCAVAAKLDGHFDVTILEAGVKFEPFAYKVSSFELMRRAGLFLDERMIQPLFSPMRVLKTKEGLVHVDGCAVGGTTTLATGNALRYDRYLQDLGINLDDEFAELAGEIPVTLEHASKWSDLTVQLFTVFEDLGLDPQVTPKFMTDAKRCCRCGKCVLGCKYGAKWTADKLLDAHPTVKIFADQTVERVIIEDGRATGVVVSQGFGKTKIMEADLVVLAAGGLNTPVILNASGIATEAKLFVDPVLCVAAPWPGAKLDTQLPMPFVSQREGYILSPYFDWLSFFFNKSWRMPSTDIMSIMIKFADCEQGSFDGRKLDKPMLGPDKEVIERSVEEASQVLERMGISRDQMFLGTLNAGHPGGCLPLTEAEAETMHNPALPENLYVADASLFPKSMGNPPILTIMAMATRIGTLCNAKFGG